MSRFKPRRRGRKVRTILPALSRRLSVELLEKRCLLTVVTVNTNLDIADAVPGSSISTLISSPGADGKISLREAIIAANATAGSDTIQFAINSGPQTINLTSALPTITDTLEIRGDTQPGFAGSPIIELNGTGAGASAHGLNFTSSANTIRGLVINRFARDGLVFSSSNFNIIVGNYIGTDLSGAIDRGNGQNGLSFHGGGNTFVGGESPTDRNVISGNTNGIYVDQASLIQFKQNYIGTNAAGTGALPNSVDGLVIFEASQNTIGGTTAAARNVISGNGTNGIVVFGTNAKNNSVLGNFIGTNAAGNAAVGNGIAGVLVTGYFGGGGEASLNTIGGTQPGAGNLISGNTLNGIEFFAGAHHNTVQGNLIGTTADGMSALGNGGDGTDFNGGYGIDITNAPNNVIGGDDDDDGTADGIVAARNVISGNVHGGISMEPSSILTSIQGNLIGTNIAGTAAVPNLGFGIYLDAVTQVTIGGTTAGAGNTISGNYYDGIRFSNGSNQNKILGNRIGTDPSGTVAIPNEQNGIFLIESSSNLIGDYVHELGTEAGNIISGNGAHGISIYGLGSAVNSIRGNIIGLNAAGSAKLSNQLDGIRIESAPSNNIGAASIGSGPETLHGRNLLSGNGLSGANIFGSEATGNSFVANWIGLNSSGTGALGNSASGISIDSASQNLIQAGNIISGNDQHGVEIVNAIENQVTGNTIGLDFSGASRVPNGRNGIILENASANIIGGATPTPGNGAGNVISGNDGHGILIRGSTAITNIIRGNMIGLARDGETARGNRMNGVRIEDGQFNSIGGENTGDGNTIARNGDDLALQGHGIVIVSGLGNAIRRNSIYLNRGRGIDLGDDSFNLNDPTDADTGANALQNAPFVQQVEFLGAHKKIVFGLNSLPNTFYSFDFFANEGADDSGYGEGRTLLDTLSFATDDAGSVLVDVLTSATNQFISATATDPFGNTSEFSMVDTDADGLADSWEIYGIDPDEDGTIDLVLPNANPNHKDLYVEVDAMIGRNPLVPALNDVVAAFANAPAASVDNPDGFKGINLHWIHGGDWGIDREPWNRFDNGTPIGFPQTKDGLNGDGTDGAYGLPDERAMPNWLEIRAARRLAFRYCVFADVYGEKKSSGLAELGGDDFFVALGVWDSPTRAQQAGTFMHELGHTLGLGHGGGDETHFKPNYFSVMNYLWQVPVGEYKDSWDLDYSRSKAHTVSEAGASESAGFGGTPGRVVPIGPVRDPSTGAELNIDLFSQSGPVDLDDDGHTTNENVARDLNFIGDNNQDGQINLGDAKPDQVFHGFDDWSNLEFDRERPSIALSSGDTDDEFTYLTYLALDSIGVGPGELQFSTSLFAANENKGFGTVTVARASGTTGNVSVQYRTKLGGTAQLADYTPVTGTLHFAAGEYLKTFQISLLDDTAFEGVETILLELLNPIGATLGTRIAATLEIAEPMVVKLADTLIDTVESMTTVPVNIMLNGEVGQTLSKAINFTLSDLLTGTAVAGVDYILPAATALTFPAGAASGAKLTVNLTLLNNFADSETSTINLGLRPIDSFAAESDPAVLTIRKIDEGNPLRVVQDIWPGAGSALPSFGSGDPGRFAQIGNDFYFATNNAAGNSELWKTNGTSASTEKLAEIESSLLAYFTVVGQNLFFVDVLGIDGIHLWTSDGTAVGTRVVRDFNFTINSLASVGDKLFFSADDFEVDNPNNTGGELWVSDGTTVGTYLVKDIRPGFQASLVTNIVDLNGVAIFGANSFGFDYANELWRSDGTEAGTYMIRDIWPGNNGSFPFDLTTFGNTVYFSAEDGINGRELWKTDGTAAGTVMVVDLSPGTNPNTNDSNPQTFKVANGKLYFKAFAQSGGGWGLYTTGGTAASTVRLAGFEPFINFSPVEFQNALYFVKLNGQTFELWKSDGTVPGTVYVADIAPGYYSEPSQPAIVGNTLYFAAASEDAGMELWQSDGTQAGTRLAADIRRGPDGSGPSALRAAGGNLYFHADDGIHGRELFVILGSAPPLVADLSRNGTVDAADYVLWRNSLGVAVTNYSGGDVNGSGAVTTSDYDLWRLSFGRQLASGSTAQAPELQKLSPTNLFFAPVPSPAIKPQHRTRSVVNYQKTYLQTVAAAVDNILLNLRREPKDRPVINPAATQPFDHSEVQDDSSISDLAIEEFALEHPQLVSRGHMVSNRRG